MMEDVESEDPSLDFLSPSFDPLKVLHTPPNRLRLPHPSVQPCDNLQAYTSVVQGTRQKPRIPMSTDGGDVAPEVGGVSKGKVKKPKTVLDFMQRKEPGPFSLLQRCYFEKGRVKVVIRHCAGVRGVCEGVPLAFDRHMNIVLGKVTEWCTPFRTVANGGFTLTKNQRRRQRKRDAQQSREQDLVGESEGRESCHTQQVPPTPAVTSPDVQGTSMAVLGTTITDMDKWEVCRTVNQLFIRGDNVVLITPAHN